MSQRRTSYSIGTLFGAMTVGAIILTLLFSPREITLNIQTEIASALIRPGDCVDIHLIGTNGSTVVVEDVAVVSLPYEKRIVDRLTIHVNGIQWILLKKAATRGTFTFTLRNHVRVDREIKGVKEIKAGKTEAGKTGQV
jgi:hypothetical protein